MTIGDVALMLSCFSLGFTFGAGFAMWVYSR